MNNESNENVESTDDYIYNATNEINHLNKTKLNTINKYLKTCQQIQDALKNFPVKIVLPEFKEENFRNHYCKYTGEIIIILEQKY